MTSSTPSLASALRYASAEQRWQPSNAGQFSADEPSGILAVDDTDDTDDSGPGGWQRRSNERGFEVLHRRDGESADGADFFSQCYESDEARLVVVHEPETACSLGGLHPTGSLFERPLRMRAAQAEHRQFRSLLEKQGVAVLSVRDILLRHCDVDVLARLSLEQLAAESLTYRLEPAEAAAELGPRERHLVSDEYKRDCVSKMDSEQLVEVVLTQPTVYLQKCDHDTELTASRLELQPLCNLVFTRDQQVTTNRGLVMGLLESPVRRRESRVMTYCWAKLGVPVVGAVRPPGRLEGGDFLPAGPDLCFVGVGLRTNMAAVQQMLAGAMFGTRRVAVVKDLFDSSQQRMHLDTIFNIVDDRLCLLLDDVVGDRSPLRRLVDEYTASSSGDYQLTAHDVELGAYLRRERYEIIALTDAMQRNYGCNALNLGAGRNIFVDMATAKRVAAHPRFRGHALYTPFRHMADMYGSVHCCSQVVSRRRRCRPSTSAKDNDDDDDKPTRTTVSGSQLLLVVPTALRLPLAVRQQLLVQSQLPYTQHGFFDQRSFRAAVVGQFQALHAELTAGLGADVELLWHDVEDDTPYAAFVADVACLLDAGVGVLCALADARRRAERRPALLSRLMPRARRWIDLSQFEAHGASLDGSALTVDAAARLLFVDVAKTRDAQPALDCLARATDFRVVCYSSACAQRALFVGAHVVMAGVEALDAAFVDDLRRRYPDKQFVELSTQQLRARCAAAVELRPAAAGRPALLVSATAAAALTPLQREQIARHYDVRAVDISHVEQATDRDLSSLMLAMR